MLLASAWDSRICSGALMAQPNVIEDVCAHSRVANNPANKRIDARNTRLRKEDWLIIMITFPYPYSCFDVHKLACAYSVGESAKNGPLKRL